MWIFQMQYVDEKNLLREFLKCSKRTGEIIYKNFKNILLKQ